jgi:hypothetical protein
MEEWRDIPGYSKYQVSSLGQIRRDGKVLKVTQNASGYKQYCGSIDSKSINLKIHRVVALAFIPNPDSKPTVDHINRIVDDNRIENLRWATYTEQCINRDFPISKSSGHRHITKRSSDYIVQIRRNNTFYRKYFKTLPEAIEARDNYIRHSPSLRQQALQFCRENTQGL